MSEPDLKSDAMAEAFEKRFGVKIATEWNIIYQTTATHREDGKDFTQEHIGWLQGWDDARLVA